MRRLPVFFLPLFRPGSRQVSRTCKSFPTSTTVLMSVCTSMHDVWVGSTMNQKDLEWATFSPVAVAARACDLFTQAHARARERLLSCLLAVCPLSARCLLLSIARSLSHARSILLSHLHSCSLSLARSPPLALSRMLAYSLFYPPCLLPSLCRPCSPTALLFADIRRSRRPC